MADESSASAATPAILETDVPVSQSLIWRLQRDYYVHRGLEPWAEDLVPSYITNNPFIAEMHARIVTAFIEDCQRHTARPPLSPDNPLHLLELGAGTGKFCFLFLRKLSALLRERNITPAIIRYTMTDCSEHLLSRWRANPYLAEFVQSGTLNFALLCAGDQSSSHLLRNASGKAAGPLAVIANYVFDSLPQDAFVIDHGQISEALLTTSSSSKDAAQLNTLQLSFKNVPLSSPRYPQPAWNAILERYRSGLAAATLFFPAAALTLLQQLSAASDGRMLVLAADKGIAHEEELALFPGPPHLEFHASNRCFSTMVNLHAIAQNFIAAGGLALVPARHFTNLNICAFLPNGKEAEFPALRRAYQQAINAFGPDDLFTVMSWLNAYFESVSVPQALSLLRLTRWDATALLRLFPVLAPRLRNVIAERNDLRDAVLNTWANHYPVTPADNALAFSCGVILLELRFYPEAMAMFQASERQLGRSASTSYNLGLCAIGLRREAEALAYLIQACELDPGFEPARNMRAKLEAEADSSRS
jgi:tetratricopeptide (TPR) repeat protein